jgi:hypothetical protein
MALTVTTAMLGRGACSAGENAARVPSAWGDGGQPNHCYKPKRMQISLRRPATLLLTLFALICSTRVWAQSTALLPTAQAPLFEFVGTMFGLDPSLLEAIAAVESAGRTDAVSPKGATGLMQLMPDTARRFGVKDPFNPVQNLLGAARFLAYLHEDAGIEDLPQLLAAYNAGEGAIERYGGLPPYPETREYVRRVLLTYLLGDGYSNFRGNPVNSYPRRVLAVPQWTKKTPVRATSMQLATETAKFKTDADVLARLEEIKNERTRALKLQQSFRQAP